MYRTAIDSNPLPVAPPLEDALDRTTAPIDADAVRPRAARLLSLDVFRGLVIFAMLTVNNLGDGRTTGYFWKHADWPAMNQRQAWAAWWGYAVGSAKWQQRGATLPQERATLEQRLAADEAQLAPKVAAIKAEPNPAPPGSSEARAFELSRVRRIAEVDFPVERVRQQLQANREEQLLAASPWAHLPLFMHCTLADYVMPSFMLIIGVAIPFSIAASRAKGVGSGAMWARTVKRAAMLVLLGWVLCYFRDQFAPWLWSDPATRKFTVNFGMDVLQLLGVGYLVARVLYELPPKPRAAAAILLLLWHWAILRFYPQGAVPGGTFTEKYEAVGYIYRNWPLWNWLTAHVGSRLTIGWVGLMSVPPAAATMLLGSLVGDWLRREDISQQDRVEKLALAGVVCALVGFVWAFDLPFNKPRWSPAYLVYVSGVGALLIAILYAIIDIRQVRGWIHPCLVFGANSIAAYWISIIAKVLLLNAPRVNESHRAAMLAVKYGTLVVCVGVVLLLLWRLARWAGSYIGDGAAVLMALLIVPIVVCVRFALQPVALAPADALVSLNNAVGLSLKSHLGPWAGGWMFTICFVGFWWLVLDLMYRRRVFWKL